MHGYIIQLENILKKIHKKHRRVKRMVKKCLWTKRQRHELMKGLEEDLKRKINAVNQYITSNNIQRVKIWIHNYNTKRLTIEQKLLFYYNNLATKEEDFLKGITEYSWTGQKSQIDFLCDTPEKQQKFINDFLNKSDAGLLIDIDIFRNYIRVTEHRGLNITLKDFQDCINYNDLGKSNWERLTFLMQEIYLKPVSILNMEYVYQKILEGLTIEDIYYFTKIDPHRPLRFLHFSVDYVKEKISKYLAA
jgi:hypothetical protein